MLSKHEEKIENIIGSVNLISYALNQGKAHEILPFAKKAVINKPDSFVTKDMLVSALDAANEIEEALGLAKENAMSRIEKYSNQIDNLSVDKVKGTAIFVSGFFYSGSGAVVDYLLDQRGSKKWTPYGEPRLIKGKGGIVSLNNHFMKGEYQKGALNFYLHIVGRKHILKKSKGFFQWSRVNSQGKKMIKDTDLRHYSVELLKFFLDVCRVNETEYFSTFIREKMRSIIQAALADSFCDILVFDQAVNAWRIHLTQYLPPSTFIIVYRDPRDQFAEARSALAKSGRGFVDVENFVEEYKKRRILSSELTKEYKGKYGHKFIWISFEEFVLCDESRRLDLLAPLKLELDQRSDNGFDADISRRNIGKYSEWISEKECSIIKEQLKDYLAY